MAMTSLISLTPTCIAIAFLAFIFILSPSHCFNNNNNNKQPSSSNTFRGLVVAAEKTRLGSTPPSCHNKCNECHPCMAVQVPTMPSHDGAPASFAGGVVKPVDYYDQSPASSNRYSNYKPLGWKCRCDGHFYNP